MDSEPGARVVFVFAGPRALRRAAIGQHGLPLVRGPVFVLRAPIAGAKI